MSTPSIYAIALEVAPLVRRNIITHEEGRWLTAWRYHCAWVAVANTSSSHRAGWEILTCCVCGERIYMNGPRARGVEFRYYEGTARHGDCKRAAMPR